MGEDGSAVTEEVVAGRQTTNRTFRGSLAADEAADNAGPCGMRGKSRIAARTIHGTRNHPP